MKKILIVILYCLFLLIIVGCSKDNSLNLPNNTLESVTNFINIKGADNITFDDFKHLNPKEIGSGVTIYTYELEDGYQLIINGINNDEINRIDILKDNKSVKEYILTEPLKVDELNIDFMNDDLIKLEVTYKAHDSTLSNPLVINDNDLINKLKAWYNGLLLYPTYEPYNGIDLYTKYYFKINNKQDKMFTYLKDNNKDYIIANNQWFKIDKEENFPLDVSYFKNTNVIGIDPSTDIYKLYSFPEPTTHIVINYKINDLEDSVEFGSTKYNEFCMLETAPIINWFYDLDANLDPISTSKLKKAKNYSLFNFIVNGNEAFSYEERDDKAYIIVKDQYYELKTFSNPTKIWDHK